MIDELEALLPQYGIPPGGDQRSVRGRLVLDRRSVYGGPTTPTLYHKLESGFVTDGPRAATEQYVYRYRAGLLRVEPFYGDLEFVTVVVSREHFAGLRGGRAGHMVPNTFQYGGLDYLGREMRSMPFISAAVTSRWADLGLMRGCEPGNVRCHTIRPASIPSTDELVAYAGVLRHREDIFRQRLQDVFPNRAGSLLAGMTAPQRRAWTQLAFGRQGGNTYQPRRGPSQLASGRAGLVTILGAGRHFESEGRPFTLQSIFDEPEFRRLTSVRIAQARAVEAALLDRYSLLRTGYRAGRDADSTCTFSPGLGAR